MTNIFSKLFDKKEVIDTEKLTLAAQLSIQHTLADPYLIGLAAAQQKLDLLQPYLQLINEVDVSRKINLSEEIENLDRLIMAYKALVKENLFISIQNNIPVDTDFQIEPFTLFPLVQNAIQYGYNSLKNYPIRIKINLIGENLKIEVSNRVNHYIENQSATSLITNFQARLVLKYADRCQLLFNSNTMLFKATLLLK